VTAAVVAALDGSLPLTIHDIERAPVDTAAVPRLDTAAVPRLDTAAAPEFTTVRFG